MPNPNAIRPNVRTYFDRGGLTPLSEHDKQIDFRTSIRHTRWQIMTFVSPKEADGMGVGLMERGLHKAFNMSLKPLKSLSLICVVLRPVMQKTEAENCRSRRALIAHLHRQKLRIVWKEDRHGYEIDVSGRIIRQWELGGTRPLMLALPGFQLPAHMRPLPPIGQLPLGERPNMYDY